MKLLSTAVSILLTPLLAVGPLLAQSLAELHIVRQPDNAAATAAARSLTVQVNDASGNPVGGATVVFRLPEGATAGTFADGTTEAIRQTDAAGQAHAEGITSRGIAAAVPVRVTASKGNAHAGLLIEEPVSGAPAAAPVPMPVLSPIPKAVPAPVPLPPVPGVVVENRMETGHAPLADDSPDANVPIRHVFGPDTMAGDAGGDVPRVSILSSGGQAESGSGHHGKVKWIVAIAAAAGAGAAFAILHKGSSSSSSSSAASGISIGSPSISVGHP